MINVIIEVALIFTIFYFEDILIYKRIKKIDKKKREELNDWELKHYDELEKRAKKIG